MNHLELKFEAGVATVTLNRPEVRNAFNDEVIQELTAMFMGLAERQEVRCVVLTGSGAAFCAGADLNWMKRMTDYTREQNIEDAEALARMMRIVYSCPKPTIARIQGDVYAGGCGLVAACDIAVTVDSAQFCLSEVRLGLIPATISPYVIRAMGERAAHRYFLTAERFDALDATVAALAETLVANGPVAMKECKQLVQDVGGRKISTALIARTVEGIADIRVSSEGREGVASFLEKRKPSWRLD
jgi:methylglutaconyl-CoA hydratase